MFDIKGFGVTIHPKPFSSIMTSIKSGILCFLTGLFLFATFASGQSRPINLLNVPRPDLPSDYGQLDAEGSVILTIAFQSNGDIGDVSLVKGFIPSLDKLALSAARKIKFEPQIQDGKPADVSGIVSYYYSWRDSGWRSPKFVFRTNNDPQAEAVIQKAVQNLGGERYLNVRSQIGRGRYSIFKDGAVVSFQSFLDVIVFPEKERTEFRNRGILTIQTNSGSAGWVYDGEQEVVREQNEKQVANFKRGMRVSLDNLLRGGWRGDAELTYVGKRPATLGKRNEVIKLAYKDGLTVEFEFAADDGTPQKAIYKSTNADGEEVTEEDRYAQFVDVDGVRSPFIIDRFTNKVPSSRINYESVEFNRSIPDSIFAKPASAKEAKKGLKL